MILIRSKRQNLQGYSSKFPPVTYLDRVNYFLFSLTKSTEGRIKGVQKFGVLQLVHIRMGQASKNKIVWKNNLGY